MKIRITAIALIALLAAGFAPRAVQAAGIQSYTSTGAPFKWDNSQPIVYDLDLGKLGALSNTQAAAMVAKAFQAWSSVSTAQISFEEGDPLDRDVTGADASDFFNGLPSDVNPVIFDNDGSVIDSFLGTGASLDVLAVGGPLQNTPTGLLAQGTVIINARAMDGQFDPDDVTQDVLTRATEQAIGQMLGLANTDLNSDLIFDGNVADLAAVPVMHPGTVINGFLIPVLAGGALTLDDQMAISALYPATAFATSTGTIQGQVLLPDGKTGLQGIDVIARKVDDPVNSAVSAITGESFQSDHGPGSHDPSMRGAFTLHVPPGSYTLEFRPLRRAIGPLDSVFPLPGGDQFYQASGTGSTTAGTGSTTAGTGSTTAGTGTTTAGTGTTTGGTGSTTAGTTSPTAGPAVPASATPVMVTAGQTMTVNLVTPGTAAPAPQAVTAVTTPHSSTVSAQVIPLSATVTGHVAPSTPGTLSQIVQDYGGQTDVIEDLYRLDVPEQSILTLELSPKDLVDLDLYVFAGIPGGATSPVAAASATDGTDPEALQAVLGPGTYYIGVSAWDNVQHGAPTDYTLSVTTTPLPAEPTPERPVLNQFVLGNITDKSADVSWISDTAATSVAVVGMPLQQFGDPTLGQMHHLTLSGLTPGAFGDVSALSQNAAGELEFFPKVYFRTADSMPATAAAPLQAAVYGMVQDAIYNGDMDLNTQWLEVAIQNSGAPVTNVQIIGLTASSGWKLAVPVTQPLTVGGIGSNGIAIVGVRLLRDGTGPAPLATVTGTGTATAADGSTANFTLGP